MLDGLRVLDLSRLMPGPYASLYLAALGAEVIKVEDPRGGDPTRHEPAGGPFFGPLNRGKKSLALAIRDPRGRDLFLALARRCDVVLESFRPGVAAALGIGYDAVRAVNPGVVYCSLTGYGQSGPNRDLAGHDINYLSLTGVLGLCGPQEGVPAIPPVQVADLGGAMLAVISILAALAGRERSGRGCYLDAAMTDLLLSWLVLPAAQYLATGQAPERGGFLLTGGVVCYNVYGAGDGGYVALGALEHKFWAAFCRAVQRPDLLPHALAPARAGEPAYEALRALFAGRSRDEWAALGRSADCCLTPVLTLPEALAGAQARDRGVVRTDGAAGGLRLGLPAAVAVRDLGPAPALGADTAALLAEAGITPAEMAQLRNEGVIHG